jgi:predicted transcriptional regulator
LNRIISFLKWLSGSQFLLVKKSQVLLANKYAISQKILTELANFESRHILFATMKYPKSLQDISQEEKIPLSSVYKRIKSLKDCSLIHEQIDFAENGHVTRYYQSKIKDIEISITKFEPKIMFTKNNLVKK